MREKNKQNTCRNVDTWICRGCCVGRVYVLVVLIEDRIVQHSHIGATVSHHGKVSYKTRMVCSNSLLHAMRAGWYVASAVCSSNADSISSASAFVDVSSVFIDNVSPIVSIVCCICFCFRRLVCRSFCGDSDSAIRQSKKSLYYIVHQCACARILKIC